MCVEGDDISYYKDYDILESVVTNKVAAVTAVFIFYVIYMIVTALGHFLREIKGRERYAEYFT